LEITCQKFEINLDLMFTQHINVELYVSQQMISENSLQRERVLGLLRKKWKWLLIKLQN
jgi:hypothetical protein